LPRRLPSLLACRNDRGHLPLHISKTSMSFVKTIIVFFTFSRQSKSVVMQRQTRSSAFFTFLRLSKYCVLQRQSRSSVSLHFRDFNVLRQDYYNLLYISKTIKVFCFKTITIFFTFSRLSKYVVLWRLSMSFALYIFKDHQSFVSKTIRVFRRDFNVSFTWQDFKVFRLIYLMPLTLLF